MTDSRNATALRDSSNPTGLSAATVRAALFDHLTPEQVGQLEEIGTRIEQALQGEGAQAAPEGLPWLRRSSSACGADDLGT